jgi:hypothetical protein
VFRVKFEFGSSRLGIYEGMGENDKGVVRGRHRVSGDRRTVTVPWGVPVIGADIVLWTNLWALDPSVAGPAAPAAAFLLVVAAFGVATRD